MVDTSERVAAPTLPEGLVGPRPHPRPRLGSLRRAGRLSLAALVIGLAATAALSWACFAINLRNEHRLLGLQTKEAATVLQVSIPVLQTPLASAAEIAATSDGDPAQFRRYISSYVGTKRGFTTASLWRITTGRPKLVAVAGTTPALPADPARADAFLEQAARTPALDVIGLMGTTRPRLGYAFASTGQPRYVVYAESPLPAGRRVSPSPDAAFADLNFALYLGPSARPDALLEATTDQLPIRGHTVTESVPFGTSVLTMVASRGGRLGGALSADLWWLVAIAGTVVSGAAALIAERLVRRRKAAERLSREVGVLLREQRGIAETLQRALLPQRVPTILGVDLAVRYIPGVSGVDIGGDWFDVIALDERRFFFAVGDVSGRGVSAGATMAALHFAIRGFVSEGHGPAAVLQRLAALIDLRRDGHFATVLCGIADGARGEVTLASAGHLPPLLLRTGAAAADGPVAEFVAAEVGAPIGVPDRAGYAEVTIAVGPGMTLLAVTDGLVERRGETIDDGLHRLRDAALGGAAMPIDDQLNVIVGELVADARPGSPSPVGDGSGFDDDTAILGVRWKP